MRSAPPPPQPSPTRGRERLSSGVTGRGSRLRDYGLEMAKKKDIPAADLERRKQVRLRLRGDLTVAPQMYEGRTYYVVKDPVSLRYWRFKEDENYLIEM